MDLSDPSESAIWYSKLEIEVRLSELCDQLSSFPDNEKSKLSISWLANSFGDLCHQGPKAMSDLIVHTKLVNQLASESLDLPHQFGNVFLNEFVRHGLAEAQDLELLLNSIHAFRVVMETISEPDLVRKLMEFGMEHLNMMIPWMKSANFELVTEALALLRAFLEFHCEDFWHEAVLQYLLPMKHLLLTQQQKAIPGVNFEESATKFLELIPLSILEAVSPEQLQEQFTQYFLQEVEKVQNAEALLAPLDSEPRRNNVFPKWNFKYDGTDVLLATRRVSKVSGLEEYYEDDLFQYCEDEHSSDDLTLTEEPPIIRVFTQPITTMSIRDKEIEDTVASTKEAENQGYYGPLLEAAFSLLQKWAKLEPDTALALSDLLSVLARSQIPLVTSILLDFSTVLQPYFLNFHGILHSIRLRMDATVKEYPVTFVRRVWTNAVGNGGREKVQDLSFGDSIRLKFQGVRSPVKSLFEKVTGASASRFDEEEKAKRLESSGNQAVAEKDVTRTVVLSHWMLELAAISQNSCWYSVTQNQTEEL